MSRRHGAYEYVSCSSHIVAVVVERSVCVGVGESIGDDDNVWSCKGQTFYALGHTPRVTGTCYFFGVVSLMPVNVNFFVGHAQIF